MGLLIVILLIATAIAWISLSWRMDGRWTSPAQERAFCLALD